MKAHLGTLGSLVVVAAIAGCGGSSPPPQTGGATPGDSSAPPVDTVGTTPEPPPTAELLAGIKAFDAGNFADARTSFEAATKKDPKNYEAFFNLGQACEKLGDKPAAEAAYRSSVALKPEFDTAVAALSSLMLDAQRIDDAMAVAKAGLAKHPGSAPLHENLGIALAMHGDQDPAAAEMSQAIKTAPSEPMYHITFAHWLNAWHVRGAAPHLDAARDLVKDDYAMLAEIGFEYRMAGEFDSCIKTFDRAVAIKDGGEVRTERALCKLGVKDEPGTLADLQAAVAKEPNYAPAHYYLGGRLAGAKHYKEAAAEYAKYLELAPSGSLAKPATEKLKMAQDAAAHDKGGAQPPPKKKK
ncbi:MAG TPA: tetratricopeptide repeat protein [Polyangiaceae bacterium]